MHILITKLSKKYGESIVLNNFNYEFKNGIYGLLGQNGAGKTTFLKILLKLINTYSGNIEIDGKKLYQMKDNYFAQIGYLPQSLRFYDHFTASEMMMYIGKLKAMKEKDVFEYTEMLFKELNLTNCADKKVGSFSGGMKQRLGICQALINNPKLVIFDEPTASLDPIERINFRNLVSKLSKDKIIIISTHIVEDIAAIANEVLILKNGIICASGTPENLLKSINGKTFEKKVDYSQYNSVINTIENISTVINNGEGYTIRYISEQKKQDDLTIPNMEEMFIYYSKVKEE